MLPRYARPAVVAPLVLTLVGLGMVVNAAHDWWRGRQALTWPATGGMVTAARRITGARSVYPEVEYRYRVDGRPYHGSRLQFGLIRSARLPGAAEQILARYPVGAAVWVRYDPANPGRAVLDPGPHPDIAYSATLGVAVAVAAAWALRQCSARWHRPD